MPGPLAHLVDLAHLAHVVDLVDLVLPRRCVACSTPGAALCAGCTAGCATGPPFAVSCGPVEVRAAATYDDAVRRAIIAYKERGRRELAAPLAELLAASSRAMLAAADVRGPVVLVAPPSSRAAAAARGGDHMQRLARRSARRAGVGTAPGVLHAVRRVQDSAGLGVAQRQRNLYRSLAARPPSGRQALLVDDVVTTGATLREADRALRAAGWTVLGAAVVAATPRRYPANPLAAPR